MNERLHRLLADYDAHQGGDPVKGCRCPQCRAVRAERRQAKHDAKIAVQHAERAERTAPVRKALNRVGLIGMLAIVLSWPAGLLFGSTALIGVWVVGAFLVVLVLWLTAHVD